MIHLLQLDPDKLTLEQRESRAVQKIQPAGFALSFLYSEAFERGFFLRSNLTQVQAGVPQLPLLTWPFLDYINCFPRQSVRLVELGAGNSTLWFAKRFSLVCSYETNESWVSSLSPSLPQNVSLIHLKESKLVQAEVELCREDWLLVDFSGRRSLFLLNLFKKKSKSEVPKVIILDNADWYRNGARILRSHGYHEIPFFGFKSGQVHLSCTSLFLSDLSELKSISDSMEVPSRCIRNFNNQWDKI